MVTPLSCLAGSWYNNTTYLPFVQVGTNSTNPFTAAGSYNVVGPFFAQSANVVTYGIDSVQLDFIET